MTEDIRPPRRTLDDEDKRARLDRIRARVRAPFKCGGDPIAIQAATLAVYREALADLAWLILELDDAWLKIREPSGVTEPVEAAMIDAFTIEPDPVRAPLIQEPPHPRRVHTGTGANIPPPRMPPPPLPRSERLATPEELQKVAQKAIAAAREAEAQARALAEISGLFVVEPVDPSDDPR